MTKVFMSYTQDGSKNAAKLEEDLKKQNITIWIDKKRIQPGRHWLREIDNALYQVDYVLGVITERTI